jgi:translation elongation factor EF-4
MLSPSSFTAPSSKPLVAHGSRNCVRVLLCQPSWVPLYLTTLVFPDDADKVIPRQLFEVPIQAVIGRKVIARENLSAMRADVTAGLYGGRSLVAIHGTKIADDRAGHYERKKKHLDNQRESKKRLKRIGTVDLPQEAFFDIMSSTKK